MMALTRYTLPDDPGRLRELLSALSDRGEHGARIEWSCNPDGSGRIIVTHSGGYEIERKLVQQIANLIELGRSSRARMTQPRLATDVPTVCSFCGKAPHETSILVAGPGGIHICNECIFLSVELLQDQGVKAPPRLLAFLGMCETSGDESEKAADPSRFGAKP